MKIRVGILAIMSALCSGTLLHADLGTVYLSGSTPAGFTPGPYQGTLNGVDVQLFCDDVTDDAPIGGNWLVNVTSLSGSAQNTRFGSAAVNPSSPGFFPAGTTQAQLPTGTTLYYELAWLFTQLSTQHDPSVAQGIQEAAWDLASPAGPTDSLLDAKAWIAAATTDFDKTGVGPLSIDGTSVSVIDPNYDAWVVLTDPAAVDQPEGGIGNQELLALRATPEPASFALLALGFAGFSALASRRKASARGEE